MEAIPSVTLTQRRFDFRVWQPSAHTPSTTSKSRERRVNSQIPDHLTRHDLLYPLQSGFCKGHSTLSFAPPWHKALDKGDAVGVVALDISKALNSINHSIMLHKLGTPFDLSSATHKWSQSYLFNRHPAVYFNGMASLMSPTAARFHKVLF